MSIMNNSTYAR